MNVNAGVKAFKTPTKELLNPSWAAQNMNAGTNILSNPDKIMYGNFAFGISRKYFNANGKNTVIAATKRMLATCQGEKDCIPFLTNINELPHAKVKTKNDTQICTLMGKEGSVNDAGDFLIADIIQFLCKLNTFI